MLYFVRRCAAGTRGAGLLRAVMTLAAMITIFSILGATGSGDAHAQMTARNQGLDAQIPDSPCMTSAERYQLRKISDEYNVVRGQLDNLDAQIEQDSSYKEYSQANDLLNRVAKNGAYESSDEMHAAEAAKKTVARLDRLRKLINRRAALAQRLTEIATKFYDLVHAIENRKCPPPAAADDAEHRIEIGSSGQKRSGPFHPFFALEGGGGWSNTNFEVAPPFSVSGSSFVGGINGGVLIDIPGTIFSVGPRIGWQGGNMSGTTSAPIASPFFDYTVKTKSIFYQELMLQVPINLRTVEPKQFPRAYPFITVSAGIAEAQTQFTGTSGAFQVTDTVTQTGFAGTVGIGMPISQPFLGGAVDVYAQYRFIVLPDTTVSIPGRVHISSYKPESVTLGFRYQW